MKYADKNKLLNTVHYNEVISEFHPNHFYSVKDMNINYTKSNILPKLKNISRDFENIYSTEVTPMFSFSLIEFADLFSNSQYIKCYELIELNLKNLLSYYDKSNIDIKQKLEKLYKSNKINYLTLSYSIKIYEMLQNNLPYFLVRTNKRLYYTETELAYNKYDKKLNVEECK